MALYLYTIETTKCYHNRSRGRYAVAHQTETERDEWKIPFENKWPLVPARGLFVDISSPQLVFVLPSDL